MYQGIRLQATFFPYRVNILEDYVSPNLDRIMQQFLIKELPPNFQANYPNLKAKILEKITLSSLAPSQFDIISYIGKINYRWNPNSLLSPWQQLKNSNQFSQFIGNLKYVIDYSKKDYLIFNLGELLNVYGIIVYNLTPQEQMELQLLYDILDSKASYSDIIKYILLYQMNREMINFI